MIKKEDIKEGLRFTLPNGNEQERSKAKIHNNRGDDWIPGGYAVNIETYLGDSLTITSQHQLIFQIVSINAKFNIARVSPQMVEGGGAL